MSSDFGTAPTLRLRPLIPESAAFRADRVEPLLHHEVGTHVVTYQNGARQPQTLLTIGLPGYDETQEGLAVLAEYLTGGLDPRRSRVLAARVVAVGKMLDGAGFLDIFESLRADHRMPARTAWSIAIRVVVGGGSVKDAIYLRGITRILDALAEGSRLDVLLVGKNQGPRREFRARAELRDDRAVERVAVRRHGVPLPRDS